VSSPFLKYIDGLRWSTRYEYRASASFPSFVQTERALTIQRDVVFTCNDGSQQAYKFIFLVQDENTEAVRPTIISYPENFLIDRNPRTKVSVFSDFQPQFNRASYNFTASLSQISNSSQPLNLNITVSDADVDIRNANVLIRSSNPYVTLLNIPLFENEIPDVAYIYRSELVIDWASLSPGTYQVILTADDGKYSALAYLNLNLNP
jgi:hypothetical protein